MGRNWQKSPEAQNEFCIEGSVVWIKLNKGQETCIDLEDWPKIAPIRWIACKTRHGYYYAKAASFLHKLIVPSLRMTDHVKGDSLDNRKSQLRSATVSQNCANRGLNSNNTSGFKGVWPNCDRSNRWSSKCGGQYLGRFDNPIEAAMTYDRAALEKYGEFSRLNFPRGQFCQYAL